MLYYFPIDKEETRSDIDVIQQTDAENGETNKEILR